MTVGIVGLGYVGLPLVLEFADRDVAILGFDTDEEKIRRLKRGESYIGHIPADRIKTAIAANPDCDATTDFTRVSQCDAILICVPTPLGDHREPDLGFIIGTAEKLGPHLRPGQLIVLESTTFPGTTEEVLVPILERESGLAAGDDFLVAYSPEREDPNNKNYSTADIPKVVGGVNAASLEAAQALYECIICRTVPVSSCRAAEATKLMENIFRAVNIALVNELKMVFSEMNIDIWEVIAAAATKPFGYMPFYPGPGLGGHCIPIDPFYLTWKAKEYGVSTRFIELAGEINTHMPSFVIQKTVMALNDIRKALRGSRILLVGLAYKKNVDDYRESPTFALWEELLKLGAEVEYYDPFCPQVRPTREHSQFAGTRSRTWADVEAGGFDAAIIATAHDSVDHDAIARNVALTVDTRNACTAAANVYKA